MVPCKFGLPITLSDTVFASRTHPLPCYFKVFWPPSTVFVEFSYNVLDNRQILGRLLKRFIDCYSARGYGLVCSELFFTSSANLLFLSYASVGYGPDIIQR